MQVSRLWGVLIAGLVLPCMVAAQSGQVGTTDPPAEQVYKNIQSLKGMPANQLTSTMQFISSSLGVRCNHCHVEGAFEKDDKQTKQKAREMIRMVTELNRNDFKGERGVTCYSCHRGALRPRRTPVIDTEQVGQSKSSTKPAEMPSSSGQALLETVLRTVGGLPALQAIQSEVAHGSLDIGAGIKFPMEMYVKKPDMRSVVIHFQNGDSIEVENGDAGWVATPQRPVHVMSKEEIAAAWAEASPFFFARAKNFKDIGQQTDRELNGVKVSVLRAANPNEAPVKLYIDQQTGLPVRIVHYVQTPLGRNPTQIDYSDYRDVGGVKLPFRWTVAQPQGRFSVQLDRIEVNVPVEDSRFTKPKADASLGGN